MFLKRILQNKDVLIFFFSLAVLFGPAVSILFAGDVSQFPDTKTYVGLFHFDFHQPNAVRRYRVIIPLIARALDGLSCGIFGKFAPTYYTGNFSMAFSFFLVNIIATCVSGVMIYHYCRQYIFSTLASVVGLLVFLTSRYTIYSAALPLVDSLFFLVLIMALLGVKTDNRAMIIIAIFLGPFAKEAFIFTAPVIFFYSKIPKSRLVLYFVLSGVLVFGYRYLYDLYTGFSPLSGISADFKHFSKIGSVLALIFSPYGLYKIFINTGIWLLLPVSGVILVAGYLKNLRRIISGYIGVYLAGVLIQICLSLSIERMFYLAMPVICLVVAFSVDEMMKQLKHTLNYSGNASS